MAYKATPMTARIATALRTPAQPTGRGTRGLTSCAAGDRVVPQERFDLGDARIGVAVADVDQRAREGAVEEQVAHQVAAFGVGRTEAFHEPAERARHAV